MKIMMFIVFFLVDFFKIEASFILHPYSFINKYIEVTVNSDGQVYKPFGIEGSVYNGNILIKNFIFSGKVIQDSLGRYLIAGTSEDFKFCVIRYFENGNIDKSFGDNGVVFIPLIWGEKNKCLSIIEDNKGNYVLAGQVQIGSENIYRFAAVRLSVSGSLDMSFGNEGIFVAPSIAGGTYHICYSIIQDNSGKYLLIGAAISNNNVNVYFAAVRLLPNGSLDETFGNNTIGPKGTLWIENIAEGIIDYCFGVIQDSLGKYVLVGSAQIGIGNIYRFAAVRLNIDGSLDEIFGDNGVVVAPSIAGGIDDSAHSVIQDNLGNYVLAGYVTTIDENGKFGAVRLLLDGSLDKTFGNNIIGPKGTLWIDSIAGGINDEAFTIIQDVSGKYLLTGYASNYGDTEVYFAAVRLLKNGTLDEIFGNNMLGPQGTLYIENNSKTTSAQSYSVIQNRVGNYILGGVIKQGSNYFLQIVELLNVVNPEQFQKRYQDQAGLIS